MIAWFGLLLCFCPELLFSINHSKLPMEISGASANLVSSKAEAKVS
jgi:hypothetical protein